MMNVRKLFLLIPCFLERWVEVFFNSPLWKSGMRGDFSRGVVRGEVGKSSPTSLAQRREVQYGFFQRGHKNTPLAWVILPAILGIPVLSWSIEPPSLCVAGERVFFDCAVTSTKGSKRVSLCG